MVEDYQINDQLIQDQLGSTDGDAILDVPLEGPSSSDHASIVYFLHDASGIANYGRYQNEESDFGWKLLTFTRG